MKKLVLIVLSLTIVVPCIWIRVFKYEGEKPTVNISLPSLYLKKFYEMSLDIEDNKTGLRGIIVSIEQKNKKKILFKKQYESFEFPGFLSGAKITKDSFVIPVHASQYGMSDGEAVIKITVSDYSWRGWNQGNILEIEKKVTA